MPPIAGLLQGGQKYIMFWNVVYFQPDKNIVFFAEETCFRKTPRDLHMVFGVFCWASWGPWDGPGASNIMF